MKRLFTVTVFAITSVLAVGQSETRNIEGTTTSPATVNPQIQCSPAALYLAAQRGETKSAVVEIVNHEKEPLKILAVHSMSNRFTTELKTLEEGQRYALTIHLSTNNTAGRFTDTIVATTSSKSQPTIGITANVFIKERIHFAPEVIDFPNIASPLATKNRKNSLSQILTVYRESGSGDLAVTAETQLDCLRFSIEKAETNRVQLRVHVQSEKLEPGLTTGSVVLKTNDPEFPQLEVPVSLLLKETNLTADYRE